MFCHLLCYSVFVLLAATLDFVSARHVAAGTRGGAESGGYGLLV